jgi:hypothetical protein
VACQEGDLTFTRYVKRFFRRNVVLKKIGLKWYRKWLFSAVAVRLGDCRSDEFERDCKEVVEAYSQHCTDVCPDGFRKYLKKKMSL